MGLVEILKNARRAKVLSGRGVIAQLVDIVRLRLVRNGIRPDFYYNYRLYDPSMSWDAKSRFVGPWIKSRIYRIQDPATTALCNDKLRTYALLGERGLAYPRLLAATHPQIGLDGMAALHGPAEVGAWLRDSAPDTFFIKPSVSYLGYGSRLVVGRDGDRLHFGNGDSVDFGDFATQHGAPGKPVLLFQERILPHPLLAERIGQRAATARFVVFNDRPEPEVIAVGLRIPSGNSMTDNFQSGRSGNLMAFVDVETGRIWKVLAGLGFNWREVESHPDTGQRLLDFVLPDWRAATELVAAGSMALPGLKIHGWDVAFSDKGPLLVETNPRGDLNLAQLARGRGLIDERFLSMYPGNQL